VLIYFNEEWKHKGGQLRLTRSKENVDDYYAEVAPVAGNLLAFRRNDVSWRGFPGASGERRSIQMCYVDPRRDGKRKVTGWKKAARKAFRKTAGLRRGRSATAPPPKDDALSRRCSRARPCRAGSPFRPRSADG
jgi:hypothetical protein